MSKKRKIVKISFIAANILLVIGLGFSSVFFFLKYNNLKNNNLTDDQKIAKYQKEISKTYTLPSSEKPTLGTVNDANEIKKTNPTFFKDLANKDILLIYEKAPLVIVYRPSTKKIINSGPLSFTNKVAVELIGAKADRDAATAVLSAQFAADVSVSGSKDAKAAVVSTIIVDATGKNAALATKLATELSGVVGQTPEGQDAPAQGTGVAVYIAPKNP